MKIAIFADGMVGQQTVAWLLDAYPDHVKQLVLTGPDSPIRATAQEHGLSAEDILYHADVHREENQLRLRALAPELILLAWWPHIIREPLISLPALGVLNFHPSLLPHNRGKHYNFWTLVEDSPFGVSIHFVEPSVDSGDVVFQRRIDKGWEDTGASLYAKAQTAMLSLFRDSYPKLVRGEYTRTPQQLHQGSYHAAAELEPASEILLDDTYSARELLNLLRARTFPPHPGCHFEDQGRQYEVRVEIKERTDER
jgi:methionyl-tRNA formyltransferase